MKHAVPLLTALLLAPLAAIHAADSTDPFTPYLDGKAPAILREVASTDVLPENITVRRVVLRSRDDSEIFALIATPKTTGKHPGLLVLHGGGGSAAVDQAMAWAQRGYVAVAPDMPGIADPKKLTETKGKWSALPATKTTDNCYGTKLPAEAVDWFVVVSDDRPVTVSSDLINIRK